jgi:hypothetical protein
MNDKPWFLNRGKTSSYIHQNLLLGFTNWPVFYYKPTSFLAPSSPCHQQVFWRRCRGLEEEEAPTSTIFSHVNLAPAASFLALLPGRK